MTLHPIIVVRHAPKSTELEPVIQKEYPIIISDHLNHESNAVYVFTQQQLSYLQNNPGPQPIKVLHRFSDNCATQ